MEENKYYTPEISEFFVGFEYEEQYNEKTEFYKNIVNADNCDYPDYDELGHLKWKCECSQVRVKYLDKQDLIELGFEEDLFWSRESIDNPDKSYSLWDRKSVVIRYEFDKEKYCIYDYCREIHDQRLFEGRIKNKSELVKLLKMLGIK